jgi:hypothetical protein
MGCPPFIGALAGSQTKPPGASLHPHFPKASRTPVREHPPQLFFFAAKSTICRAPSPRPRRGTANPGQHPSNRRPTRRFAAVVWPRISGRPDRGASVAIVPFHGTALATAGRLDTCQSIDVATVTPSEALQHILTLVETSAELKDDTQRKVLLRSVVVVAQKGLGVAPDGVAECEPNVLTFPTR